MTVQSIVKSVLLRKVDTALEVSIAALFLTAMAFGGWTIAAHAQPAIPDEAAKVRALKRAYELNGNSMVGSRMIDLTQDQTAADPMPQHPANAGKVATPRKRQ